MLPASLAGLILLCALVPGYIYLTMTERLRAARDNVSQLQELVETVAAGLAATLPTVALFGIACPNVIRRASHALPGGAPASDLDLRLSFGLLLGVPGVAVLLAYVGAKIMTRDKDHQSEQTAWRDALKSGLPKFLGLGEPGTFSTYVYLELIDGRSVEGRLRTFDTIPAGNGRDIALQSRIFETDTNGKRVELDNIDGLVISEEEIKQIRVLFRPL